MNRLIGVMVLIICCVVAYGQDTRNTESPRKNNRYYQSSKKEKKGLFKKKETNQGKNEVAEFRARLQKVYKQKAKEERQADKPRYKDPSYFGHKRKPKKRPVGKQKFCKICKIKH